VGYHVICGSAGAFFFPRLRIILLLARTDKYIITIT
jgi:hypothetical protein